MENIWGVPTGPDWQHLPAEAVQNGALHSIPRKLIMGSPCSGPLGLLTRYQLSGNLSLIFVLEHMKNKNHNHLAP